MGLIKGKSRLGIISGMPSTLDFSTVSTDLVNVEHSAGTTRISINVNEFTPGSIVMYRTVVNGSGIDFENKSDMTPLIQGRNFSPGNLKCPSNDSPIKKLWSLVRFEKRMDIDLLLQVGFESSDFWFGRGWPLGLADAVKGLGDAELNIALYRVGNEEHDFTSGIAFLHSGMFNTYHVPDFGDFVYCGLAGIVSALLPVIRRNDLGHPICANLRAGPWMLDYTVARLQHYIKDFPLLDPFTRWLEERLLLVKLIPTALIPKYFAIIILLGYYGLKHRLLQTQYPLGSFVRDSNQLSFASKIPSNPLAKNLEIIYNNLCMTAVQMSGIVKSTRLFPLKYAFPSSPNFIGEWALAAGLPHFSTAHMRCWGRDVFISIRGLFLLRGKFDEARAHLIAFGSTLRHGLIPNLLDQAINPRYNARDAAWWWLFGVQEYCRLSPEGLEFLSCRVKRRFPPSDRYQQDTFGKVDDDDHDTVVDVDHKDCYKHSSTIAQVCHEILERHARGIYFTEYNAGDSLDHAMTSQGFKINCGINRETGFVFGGNRFNCGTWMDKMGDSAKAGTFGLPATPRDGSAIEIVGLCKAMLQWLESFASSRRDLWPWEGVNIVSNGKSSLWKYSDWNAKLQDSFEKGFFIPMDLALDEAYGIKTVLVNRRGIYRDTVGSNLEYADYQLRPNLCVALVVAPELFEYNHAVQVLSIVKNTLFGKLGMKTLDPSDWAYRGVYDNTNESTDSSIAHGFNYHQGPEWGWIQFYFLRAYLKFERMSQDAARITAATDWITSVVHSYQNYICDSLRNPFAGLPELTNENGALCLHSCDSQAWSNSCMIELLADLVA